jgi:uncharacterized protein YukE
MSNTADSLDRLANQLLVEARGLEGFADSIEPLVHRVRCAWEGPAADRLAAELADRRRELAALVATLRSLARTKLEEARRVRSAEASAASTPADSVGGISPW